MGVPRAASESCSPCAPSKSEGGIRCYGSFARHEDEANQSFTHDEAGLGRFGDIGQAVAGGIDGGGTVEQPGEKFSGATLSAIPKPSARSRGTIMRRRYSLSR
jgi:hypothetical protein